MTDAPNTFNSDTAELIKLDYYYNDVQSFIKSAWMYAILFYPVFYIEYNYSENPC